MGYSYRKLEDVRKGTIDVGYLSRHRHAMAGFLVVDVTEARSRIREGLKAGREISFSSWLCKCVAQTVTEHPQATAVVDRGRIAHFDTADIAMMIEKEVEGKRVPLSLVIRDAQDKRIDQISEELSRYRKETIPDGSDYTLSEHSRGKRATALFNRLPPLFRRIVWKVLLRSAVSQLRNMGNVIITSSALSGSCPGWILPKTIHPFCVAIGSIVRKPAIYKGRVEVRTIMHMTLVFDHDAIDGAPAAKFADRLTRRLSSTWGL